MVQQRGDGLPPPLLAQLAVQPLGTPPPPYRERADLVEEQRAEPDLPPVPPLVAEPPIMALRQEEPIEQVNKFLYLKLVAFYTYSVLHFFSALCCVSS